MHPIATTEGSQVFTKPNAISPSNAADEAGHFDDSLFDGMFDPEELEEELQGSPNLGNIKHMLSNRTSKVVKIH